MASAQRCGIAYSGRCFANDLRMPTSRQTSRIVVSQLSPFMPQQRTSEGCVGMSERCPKGDVLAKARTQRQRGAR